MSVLREAVLLQIPRTCAASAKPWESRLRLRRNGWNVQTIRSVPRCGKDHLRLSRVEQARAPPMAA